MNLPTVQGQQRYDDKVDDLVDPFLRQGASNGELVSAEIERGCEYRRWDRLGSQVAPSAGASNNWLDEVAPPGEQERADGLRGLLVQLGKESERPR